MIDTIDEELEKKEILRAYRRLRRSATPFIKDDEEKKLIKKAFNVASEAHKDMRRKSGEPYIFHPIAVAQIAVQEIGLGPTAIAAALLHDVVEDTDWTLEDIEREFGSSIARIVDGVTKIASSTQGALSGVSQQAENFRRMLLTLSDDVRVILLKLADRLHNMRTLESMDRRKQLRTASETIFIYAPLAHRLGLYKIKTELEDLYLKYTQKDIYEEISEKLDKNKRQRNKYINEFIRPLNETLEKHHFKARIFGRVKSVHSIWTKMQKQNIPFEKVFDLFAIRIVLDEFPEEEKSACWKVYSLVTDYYHPNPERLRDWISTPRANGYESLHTTVMGPEGKWVEVQIRTKRMDEIAEKGYAAHWKYKEHHKPSKRSGGSRKMRKGQESGLDSWLRNIRELREKHEGESAMEFINDFRANFFQEEVFAFTPKGDLKKLPVGATALDFAFEIHSEVGHHCLGTKVNQKLVPFDYKLHNGDQIEVLTSKQSQPNADWLNFVITPKAQSYIKRFLRHERREVIIRGKEMLRQQFKELSIEYNDTTLNELRIFLNFRGLSELYYNIGEDYISKSQFRKFLEWKRKKEQTQKPGNQTRTNEANFNPKVDTLVIGEDSGFKYTLAKCCNPIPGNSVFGFITINDGVKIHRTDCPNAANLMANHGYRIIKAQWKSRKNLMFQVELEIIGNDRIGLVRDVTDIISSNMRVNIGGINVGLTDQGIFAGSIKLFVRDQSHLDTLLDKLQKIEGVESITQVRHPDTH